MIKPRTYTILEHYDHFELINMSPNSSSSLFDQSIYISLYL